MVMLPATPMEAAFLSNEEKYHLVKRVATNKTGVANKEWKWAQVKEAFVDPKTCRVMRELPDGLLTHASQGLSSFSISQSTSPTAV